MHWTATTPNRSLIETRIASLPSPRSHLAAASTTAGGTAAFYAAGKWEVRSILDRRSGGHAQYPFDLSVAAVGTLRLLGVGPDQDFDNSVTRFAFVFVKGHDSDWG